MIDNEELKIPSNAIDFLSYCLKEGHLVLFLGAGASAQFGLPGWVKLVNLIRNDIGLKEIGDKPTPEVLQNGAEEVKDKISIEQLMSYLEKHLYQETHKLTKSDIFKNHLLVAFSALFNGNKKGRVTQVVTLNYDSMLEWFLSSFGFSIRTIHDLPALEGSEDVRIYHPHGYVPEPGFDAKSSSFIILGIHSVNKRIGNSNERWLALMRHIFSTSVCLFVGLSGTTLSDRALQPLFVECGEPNLGIRPLGIWLLYREPLDSAKAAEFQRNNIVPLPFDEPEKISEFILETCERAAQKINTADFDNPIN